ncbi:MAG: hypothetical protein LBU73_04090 [Helicobacteraceae bacterium]|jgi:hypothetical protein|nr:hypothetical protein [Helicobacteraceae bacterium]
MKKGAALIISMVFILLMLSFAAVFYNRTSTAFARASAKDAAISANTLLFSFAKSALDELIRTIKTEAVAFCSFVEDKSGCQEEILIEAFDILYKIPIFLDIGGWHISIACAPQGLKVDINSLKIEPKSDLSDRANPIVRRREIVEKFLRNEYKLYSSWQFFELLDFVFDTTSQVNSYLRGDTRLNITNPTLERGRISSPRVLRLIARDYAARTHDEAALKIEWEDIFTFENPGGKIDFNNMSKESCEMLFYDMPDLCARNPERRARYEDLTTRFRDANETIADFNLFFGFNPKLNCRVAYRSQNADLKYSFYYDSNLGEVSGFVIGN